MAYRWKPKNATVDPEAPRAWGTCDRCGLIHNLHNLNWQFAYQGSMTPQNTRFLVCGRCNDPLNPADAPLILGPDPLPVYNARQEPYIVDETSWMSTEDGDTIGAEDGDALITAIPNPATEVSPGEDAVVSEAAVAIETESGDEELVTEADTPLDYDPNPGQNP